ncbi:hypothetical protein Pelo_5256 [Pelomyxa schiedti]|nr:hypothetical protein Pelo_5256 [Pelomyxa schiedti]
MHCSPGKKLVHIAAPKGPTISSDGKEFFEFSQCRCRCNSSVTHIGSDLQLVVDSLPCGLLTSASFKIIGNSHRKPTKNASSTKHSSLEAPPTQTASPKTPQCILTPHSNTTTPDHTPASVSPPTDTQSPNPCTETTHGPGNRSMVDNHSPSPTPKSKKQLPTRHNRHHQTKSEQPKQRAPNTQLDLLKCLQTISEMQQYHKTQEESSRKRPPTHKAPSQSASQSQTQTQTQTQTHQVKSLMPFYQQIPSDLSIIVRFTRWTMSTENINLLWSGLIKTLTTSSPGFLFSRAKFLDKGYTTIGVTAFSSSTTAGYGAKVSICYLKNSHPQLKKALLVAPPSGPPHTPLCGCIHCQSTNSLNVDVVALGLCQFVGSCTNF